MGKASKLILLRHGESEWNRLDLFTGWVDIPLSKKGIQEALEAGQAIASIPIDVIFISSLIRSHMTAMLALSEHRGGKVPLILHPGGGKIEEWANIYGEEAKAKTIPVISAWELNERMYGELQGRNKQQCREQYGAAQVKLWRRSYDIPPPEGECLKDTAARALPYFKEKILPLLNQGKNVLISAHGNSLRAIVMYLDNLSKEEVLSLEIGTGIPLIYDFENGSWKKSSV
ncbi:MAG: phosphoglycerate mutase [Chlamydiae bacterium GWC2_50_10]|nr:MAG: phosphoglycerate mutase [Chlamydiae bacterium GWA2_50_15]OGN54183.1 MAG: phosphoglycerate mutase [Chlamydiae bacterium GWC2_50_10]OGN55926.1 MAG: phosphoglycerate mutase [Chlamydiae bacterium GWF2_49_8]OGN59056.1 MAG: phosphoglycerate mutase [Chlamydiae bacterium RIFCSPHIGHO2_02_FULL_49_29]OGN69185.1 MAG: phosphoglycerate mutase [Chlamydiae bacterium RIFCSPLOWO2_02_FULL_49_12]OGN73393.1 MAG: phosphoglycerate mutase [Chlamydiae bacterium RIFCSPLOWO2_12_FULL_49_12]HAZ15472.1 2,3-bisphos